MIRHSAPAKNRAHKRAAPGVVWLNPGSAEADATSEDPAAQAEIVRRALQHLEQVRRMVCALDEVPGGDRSGLLSELSSTADSLRQLYFIDAIY